jgi:hypothetical protein
MITLFRRHTTGCSLGAGQHDRSVVKCRCMIHAEGTVGADHVKESLRTRSWQEASRRVHAAEARGSWDPQSGDPQSWIGDGVKHIGDSLEPISGVAGDRLGPINHRSPINPAIPEAIAAFLRDAENPRGRNLSEPTLIKYRTLTRRLIEFCRNGGIAELGELTTESLRAFRDTWPTGPRASVKNVERLRTMFRFFMDSGWLVNNPAAGVRSPSNIKTKQVLPFTASEFSTIVETAQTLPLDTKSNEELQLFVLTMRYSGMRISDTALLTRDRLRGDGALLLYTEKTGEPVYCPLPGGGWGCGCARCRFIRNDTSFVGDRLGCKVLSRCGAVS